MSAEFVNAARHGGSDVDIFAFFAIFVHYVVGKGMDCVINSFSEGFFDIFRAWQEFSGSDSQSVLPFQFGSSAEMLNHIQGDFVV